MLRHSDWGSTAAAILLLLILVVGPLPFGSVMPRERLGLQLAALVALVLVLAGRGWLSGLRPAARPALALAAVGGFGLLQSLCWPRPVVALLAPRIAEGWDQARTLLGEGPGAWTPFSMAPEVSRTVAIQWLAVAAGLVAASAVGRDRRHRRLLAAGLLGVAVGAIVYGADNALAQRTTVWGLEVPGDPNRWRGSFVNPDHFAGFLLIPLTAGFAWLWWSARRALRRDAIERRLLYLVVPWLVFLMLFVGLAFTGSRAGLIAAVVAIGFQTVLLVVHYRKWVPGLLGVAAVAVGFLGVLGFGLRQGLGRWMETSAFDLTWNARLMVYGATCRLWSQAPLTGTGLGTFRQAFPGVQPPELDQTWVHAHSDLLELVATTGLVGPVLLLWGLVAVIRALRRGLRRGRRSEDRAAALAAGGALVAVLVHSAFDFALTIPANAFTAAVVVGLACGVPTHLPAAPPPATNGNAEPRRTVS